MSGGGAGKKKNLFFLYNLRGAYLFGLAHLLPLTSKRVRKPTRRRGAETAAKAREPCRMNGVGPGPISRISVEMMRYGKRKEQENNRLSKRNYYH